MAYKKTKPTGDLTEERLEAALRRLGVPRDRIVELCRRFGLREFSLFGSVLRDDFRPDSDVDVMIDFDPGTTPSLARLLEFEEALSSLIGGRRVDVITRWAIEHSENYIRRRDILSSARALYVA